VNILCGTDLLPKTESAIERAAMLAEQLGADLSLLHVVAPTESARLLQREMRRARARLQMRAGSPAWRFGSPPCIRVRSGHVAPVLIETARVLNPALVVLGTHRRRPLRDALAGTIAARLLSELNCPVLIVRRMPLGDYRNVLLALDRSEASAQAVRTAEALVIGMGARASVVHAYQPPYDAMLTSAGVMGPMVDPYSEGWKQEASTAMDGLLGEASKDPSRYALILEKTETIAAVQNVVGRLNPDLLVLGTRGRGRLGRALLGSVSNRVLAATGSDVLIVPSRSGDESWRRRRMERHSLDVVAGI
jgi:universal stress protein E